jgi:hypothetical protein
MLVRVCNRLVETSSADDWLLATIGIKNNDKR